MGKNHPMSGVLSPANFDKGKLPLCNCLPALLTCSLISRSHVQPPQRCHEQAECRLGPELSRPP
jgi:hypothetical protein